MSVAEKVNRVVDDLKTSFINYGCYDRGEDTALDNFHRSFQANITLKKDNLDEVIKSFISKIPEVTMWDDGHVLKKGLGFFVAIYCVEESGMSEQEAYSKLNEIEEHYKEIAEHLEY